MSGMSPSMYFALIASSCRSAVSSGSSRPFVAASVITESTSSRSLSEARMRRWGVGEWSSAMVPSVAGITRWDREVGQDAASTAGPQLRPMLGPNAPGSLEAMRRESIARQRSEAQPDPTPTMTSTPVDLAVPVYNEESGLAASIEALLVADTGRATGLTIIIADNASTDSTPVIGAALAAAHPNVEYVRLDRKGRGRALSQVWQASDADVVAYTDV